MMPQKRNSLIKRASLYPLSFDDPPTTPPARGIRDSSSQYPLPFDNSTPPARGRSSS